MMDMRLATLCFADVTGYKEDGRERVENTNSIVSACGVMTLRPLLKVNLHCSRDQRFCLSYEELKCPVLGISNWYTHESPLFGVSVNKRSTHD